MSKIAELRDRGAVVAWSPVGEHADAIALGSKEKGGIGFDDYGGELELYDWNITQTNHDGGTPEPTLLGSVKTATRFGSLAWSSGNDVSGSILAGGMLDGTVNLWKPSALIGGGGGDVVPEDALLASVKRHEGAAVSALKFNPHVDSSGLLATGGSTGQIWMMDVVAGAASPVTVYSPNGDDAGGASVGGEVTQAAWNSQVSHILATSSASGSVVVWDLRQKKPWCELRVESSCPVSDVAWNPTQGLHLMTASEGAGGLKLWDLRASTSMPLTTLEGGHAGGVLSMDWCPHDDTLLVSCGNDNRTLLWDLYSLRPIAEIPSVDEAGSAAGQNGQNGGQRPNDFYGGGLGSSQQKRYDVSWSPQRRGVVSTCSFDRKVQAHSVIGLATKCGRPPKWMSPAGGVSCGFGGTVVSISNGGADGADSQRPQRYITINTVVEHPELASASEAFEAELASKDCVSYCRDVAARAEGAHEGQVWSFMRIMFETNAREELLSHLGFDPEKIHAAATEFVDDGAGAEGKNGDDDDAPPSSSSSAMSKQAEAAVKDALLVGNFEAAVECCFRSGNLADALVLASCGGADLWQKTQAQYFAREAERRPFLSLVSAVIHDRLPDLVASSDPSEWRETLAVLSTYGKSEEFPGLCAELGERLEGAGGDAADASLCYMCALDLGRAVKYWKFALAESTASGGGPAAATATTEDLLTLHDFVEKVTVFARALDSARLELDDEVAASFAKYSAALADQGLLVAAAKYLKGCGDARECRELRDRIYRSRAGGLCPDLVSSPPDFPYDFVNVGVASDLQGITVKQGGGGRQETMQAQYREQTQYAEAAAGIDAQTANQVQQQAEYQQQQVQAQQSQQQVQQSSQPQPTQPEAGAPSLPPGWVAIQDPSSGQTYYANQTTGESSWDPPAVAPAPAPQPAAAAADSYAAQPAIVQSQGSFSTANGGGSTSQKVASKYGDGFVTSASNPQLAEQYGNVGTSNPYSNANRPGTAAAAVGATPKKAPVSGTFDPNSMPALSEEHVQLRDCLVAVAERLAASAAGSMERKQAAEAQRGVAVFVKTLARGGVGADVCGRVGQAAAALQGRDYGTASSIVTGLVSNEWKDHKDWLKGMKFLVQMASKKQL